MIPISITHNEVHSYNDSHNTYYRVAYITTSLRAKTCAPWYEVVAASGKILKANPREYNLLPKYQDELECLRLVK
jgi:alkylated DNA nucleotide flippase Atl1